MRVPQGSILDPFITGVNKIENKIGNSFFLEYLILIFLLLSTHALWAILLLLEKHKIRDCGISKRRLSHSGISVFVLYIAISTEAIDPFLFQSNQPSPSPLRPSLQSKRVKG